MEDKNQTIRNFKHFTWTDFYDPDRESLYEIAEKYNLNIFLIHDSIEAGHLPKYEQLEDYKFLILRAFTSRIEEKATTVADLSNKVAFFYNDKSIITIHQQEFPFLKNPNEDFTKTDDVLLYIIDYMLNSYKPPLEVMDKKIGDFEKIIFLYDYTKISLEDLYYLKAQTRITKKLLQLFQGVVNQIEINAHNRYALQNIKDSLLSLILSYEEILDNKNNLLNTYHSVSSQKNNNVMKLLTIFSAFFLPLTFIAGVYGMNFDNMPELRWHLGYFITLGVMLLLTIFIFIWFKRRKIL